jgi:hypothetical protein
MSENWKRCDWRTCVSPAEVQVPAGWHFCSMHVKEYEEARDELQSRRVESKQQHQCRGCEITVRVVVVAPDTKEDQL